MIQRQADDLAITR